MDIMREVGVAFSVFDREQIRQIDPGLASIYHKGVLMDETCAVSSPADLTDAYLALFKAAGGVVDCLTVTGLARGVDGWQVHGDHGSAFHSDDVVLAAGAWSAEIAGWLGYDIPMAWERGYHLHFEAGDQPMVTRPILDVEGGFVVAPMRQGLRVTSGVELTNRDAAPNFGQITRSAALAGEAVKLGKQIEDTPWMGRRPTLVDSLPMIGSAPRHDGLWFNFGHHHIGLSMAPGSALLLAALIKKTPLPIDSDPFRVSRFSI